MAAPVRASRQGSGGIPASSDANGRWGRSSVTGERIRGNPQKVARNDG
jgi:hypothetical protein